jgi:hypothetical protein
MELWTTIEDIGSNFIPYPFKEFKMRGFKTVELFLIAESRKTNSMSKLVEAIGNTLDIDVNVLTKPDFFTLLYWQRIISYPKTPSYIDWVCNNRYMKDDKLVTCGFKNFKPVTKTDLKMTYLQKDIELDARIDFPRIKLLKSLEEKGFLDLQKDDPMSKLYYLAEWIKDGETIDDKLEIFLSQDDLDLYEELLKAASTYRYGVNESVITTCGGCGVVGYSNISFDATTFLPYF